MITRTYPFAYLESDDGETQIVRTSGRGSADGETVGLTREDRFDRVFVGDEGTLTITWQGGYQWASWEPKPRTIDTPGNDPL